MEIFNPRNIRKADLVVGIPSFNEEKTIGFVAKQAARGLKKYFPKKKSVIVNVDNNSTDRTREAFLGARSDIPQIFYTTTPKGIKGKGHNFKCLFSLFKDLKAKTGVVVDADLRNIKPEWILKLAEPVFSKYDYVSPFYTRKKDDATITNNLVYPLVYGLLGVNIRQPIGGEFAFSDKLVNVWLRKEWKETTYQFGIDIFMSLNAILSGFKMCQVNLGKKMHKSSVPNLGPMFIQVVETLFFTLKENHKKIRKIKGIKETPVLNGKRAASLGNCSPDGKHFERLFRQEFDLNKRFFKKCLLAKTFEEINKMEKGKIEISAKMWSEIVYDFLYCFDEKENSKSVEALRCLYFGRVASLFKEISNCSQREAEKKFLSQAEIFFKNREYYLNKI